MPSVLSTPRTDVRKANRDRAQRLNPMQQFELRPPLMGYVPDIDPNKLPFAAAADVLNIRSRPLPSLGVGGEFLTTAPGFEQVRPGSIGIEASGLHGLVDRSGTTSATAEHNGEVIAVWTLHRTTTSGTTSGDVDTTSLALVANSGEDSATSCGLYALQSGVWQVCLPQAAADLLTIGRDGDSGGNWIKSMPHVVNYTPGNSTHTRSIGVNAPISVICTSGNDVVFWPNDQGTGDSTTAAGKYERLDNPGAADFTNFRAITGAYWNGRMYFMNTTEDTGSGDKIYRQRIRRTARGDASEFSGAGSGVRDVRQMHRNGVRLEPLGEALACYFEDGVAFLRPTGQATNPDDLEIISTHRGLLSTHAVCSTGGDEHFGIFNDGWYFLGTNGQWRKAGIANIDGLPQDKWISTFYGNLDMNNKHRLYVHYDERSNHVYIAYPKSGDTDVEEVWVYDVETDRVWVDRYPVTCFGHYDETLRLALTAGMLDSGDTVPLGWESFFGAISGLVNSSNQFTRDVTATDFGTLGAGATGPIYSEAMLIHGNTKGLVYVHQDDITYRGSPTVPGSATEQPSFSWETGLRQQEAASKVSTFNRAKIEYVTYGNSSAQAVAYCNCSADAQSRTLDLDKGDTGTIHTNYAWFRFTSPSPGLRLTGMAPVAIRAVTLDVMVHSDEIQET